MMLNVRLLGAAMLCGVSVPNIGVWQPGSPPPPPTPSTAPHHRINELMNTSHSNMIHLSIFASRNASVSRLQCSVEVKGTHNEPPRSICSANIVQR